MPEQAIYRTQMEADDEIREAALRRQRQLEELDSRRKDELLRWREAAGLLSNFLREWEAQHQNELSVGQLRRREEAGKGASKEAYDRARAVDYLRGLAQSAKDALQKAQSA